MAFAAGVAGGLTVALLNDQKQPNIINNYYVPLSKEQAQLYIQTEKYKHYLDILITNILMYKSEEGKFKYFYWANPKTHKLHYPTPGEFREYRDKIKKQLQEKHLVILQTEGIDKLPKYDGNWQEVTTCDKVKRCCLIILCPLWCWGICCADDDNGGFLFGYMCPDSRDNENAYNQDVPFVKAPVFNPNTGRTNNYVTKHAVIERADFQSKTKTTVQT